MDKLLEKYNMGKFEECVDVLKKEIEKDDTLIENLIKQNCLVVCQCSVIVSRDDVSKVKEMQHNLYRTYQNIIAPGLPGILVPLQLELTALFNYIWWSLYYTDIADDQDSDIMTHLAVIQRGLKRGISCKHSNSINLLEDILHDLKKIGQKLKIKDYYFVSLLTETTGMIILYLLKVDSSAPMVEKCLETVSVVGEDLIVVVTGLRAVKDFENPCPLYEKLFKFSYLKINSSVLNPSTCSIECLFIIKTVCLFIMKKFGDILLTMKKNMKSALKPLWCYLGGLSAFMLGDFSQSLGFVLMSKGLNLDVPLTSRFSILHGLLLSKKGDCKEALTCFRDAKMMTPDMPAVYYYMGEEYGKVGLYDDMVKSFKSIIQIKEKEKGPKDRRFAPDVASVILDLIHPINEISEAEATYAAAVACGLSERYKESTELFEKYIEIRPVVKESEMNGDRVIKTPNFVTALHEAAAMNMVTGNVFQAHRLLAHASTLYTSVGVSQPKWDANVTSGKNWVCNLLSQELGLKDTRAEEEINDCEPLFTEEMVRTFNEDVIGLMLSAELEGKIDVDAHKAALGRLITIFSKYLAQMQKKESASEVEKLQLTLVKALSGKTFLNIAKCQIESKASAIETERTFKRALTCNQGDKDVLHEYCKFLLDMGKSGDADKLWKTFRGKETTVTVDQCQSLALRHLLRSNITENEFPRIALDLESSVMDVDCQFLN